MDPAKLWAGGLATAMVAALVAVVGILIARGIFGIAVLAPEGHGAWGNANTGSYALAAAFVALLATGLMHLLILTTPSPTSFFGWIIALLTVLAVVLPIGLFAALEQRLATAAINFVIGLAIGVLLSTVAGGATRTTDWIPPAPR